VSANSFSIKNLAQFVWFQCDRPVHFLAPGGHRKEIGVTVEHRGENRRAVKAPLSAEACDPRASMAVGCGGAVRALLASAAVSFLLLHALAQFRDPTPVLAALALLFANGYGMLSLSPHSGRAPKAALIFALFVGARPPFPSPRKRA